LDVYLGSTVNGWSMNSNSTFKHAGNINVSDGSFSNGGICMIAVNFNGSQGEIWFGRNGDWLESGNPSAGQSMTTVGTGFNTIPSGVDYYPAVCLYDTGSYFNAHFIASDMVYDIPTGFVAWGESYSSSTSSSSSSSSESLTLAEAACNPDTVAAYYTPDEDYPGGSQTSNLRASIPSTLINQNGSKIKLVFERPPGSSFGVSCSDVWCGAAIASGSTTFDGTQQAVFFNGSRSLTIPVSASVGTQVVSDEITINFTDIDFIVSFLTSAFSAFSQSNGQTGAEMRFYDVPFGGNDPSVSASIPQSESGDPNFRLLSSRSDQVIGVTAICVTAV
jgi:hypothetical protein